jgi:hypothetical protein
LKTTRRGCYPAGSPSFRGQAPIRRRMMAINSVAAAIITIHLRKGFSSSYLTSVHRKGLRYGQRYR